MNIVTGHTGTPHITSNADQALNQGIFGTGNYILDVGHKFNATLTDATTVTLEDGEGVMQGVHFRIEPGTTDTISISSGISGYNRIDLICAKYTKELATGFEVVELAVIEGEPSTGTPSEPEYTNGDIRMGESPAYFPLYKVTFTGVAPVIAQCVTDHPSGFRELLWEGYGNDGNNIAVDLSSFSAVEIWFENTITPPEYRSIQKFCKGAACANQFYGSYMYAREMTISDSGITVGRCRRFNYILPPEEAGWEDSDGSLVPRKVYGVS